MSEEPQRQPDLWDRIARNQILLAQGKVIGVSYQTYLALQKHFEERDREGVGNKPLIEALHQQAAQFESDLARDLLNQDSPLRDQIHKEIDRHL